MLFPTAFEPYTQEPRSIKILLDIIYVCPYIVNDCG
jgi:hypothetical protein